MTTPTPTPPGRLPDQRWQRFGNEAGEICTMLGPDEEHAAGFLPITIRPYIVGEDNRTDPERTLDEAVGLLQTCRTHLKHLGDDESLEHAVAIDVLLAQLPEAHDEQQ